MSTAGRERLREALEELRELSQKATPGPWFDNSYSGIFALPLVDVDEHWPIDPATDNEAEPDRYYAEADSRVASVNALHGDTATGRHDADRRLIVAAVNYVRAALAHDRPSGSVGLDDIRRRIEAMRPWPEGEALLQSLTHYADSVAALSGSSDSTPDGFVRCPLCHEVERSEDIVGGVCLTCADGIAFSQNARRGAITVGSSDPEASE